MGCCMSSRNQEKKKTSEAKQLLSSRSYLSHSLFEEDPKNLLNNTFVSQSSIMHFQDETLPDFYRSKKSNLKNVISSDDFFNWKNPLNSDISHFNVTNSVINISHNLNIIDDSCIEENVNNFNESNIYFSINSSNIMASSYYSKNDDHNYKSITNVFVKKKFIFFYFEFFHFTFWAKDYLKNVYPEINLIMVLEINDNKNTQEKIHYIRSDDFTNYTPMKNRRDINKNAFRLVIPLELPEKNNPFKISISFYTYTNHKLLSICNEEVFVKYSKENELQKYTLYQNVYMKHYNKKIGNNFFNFAFKAEEISPLELEATKIKMLETLYKLEVFRKFEEISDLNFVYYGYDNILIKENGKSENTDMQYFSISQIEEIELSEELKNELKLDRLLELLLIVKKKYELYQVLRKINHFITTKEFNEEKLNQFKEIVISYLEDFINKKNDKILITYIFNILKKAFFKVRDINTNISRSKSKFFKTDKILFNVNERSSELMLKSFNIALKYLKQDLQEDITLSALNYVFKYLEESVPININGVVSKSDEYYFKYILSKKSYFVFSEVVIKYHEYQACVQPIFGMLSKIVKNKKDHDNDLFQILITDKFREIFRKIIKIHDCNSIIMCSLFSILNSIMDFIELEYLITIISFQRLREIFNIFKMNGFDQIHELIMQLIKSILIKKNEKYNNKKNNNNSYITDNTVTNQNSSFNISDDEFIEIITIFSLALQFMRNKIVLTDFMKLSRWVNNMMLHLYTICQIINTTNQKSLARFINLFMDKKITEWIIECLNALEERNLFVGIDAAYQDSDIALINVKVMIFRSLFHCINLIKNFKDLHPATITKPYAEKLLKVMKVISDKDLLYNPIEIKKTFRKPQNLDIANFEQQFKNLTDYYTRFKKIETTWINEFNTLS